MDRSKISSDLSCILPSHQLVTSSQLSKLRKQKAHLRSKLWFPPNVRVSLTATVSCCCHKEATGILRSLFIESDCDMLVVWVFIISSLKVVSLFHCGETYHSPTQTQAPCFKCVWLSVLVGLQVFLCIWQSGLCLFSVTATMMDALMLVERHDVSEDSPSGRAGGAGQWEVSRAGRMMACVVGWRTDDTVRFNIKQVELWQQPHRPSDIISGWIKWDFNLF